MMSGDCNVPGGFTPPQPPPPRELFLRDWETSVSACERRGQEADKGAIDYSLLGIKSAFILNGGALVVLPALTPVFGINTACNKSLLVWAAAIFMVGILCAAATTALSYFTMCYQGAMHFWTREKMAYIVIGQYYGHLEDGSEREKKREEAAKKEKMNRMMSQKLRVTAICCAGGTTISFLCGAGMLLYIAWK